jgi:hypothetical protein
MVGGNIFILIKLFVIKFNMLCIFSTILKLQTINKINKDYGIVFLYISICEYTRV